MHILHGALRIAERECGHFLEAVDAINPKRAADIGCGYAFSSLLLHRRYGCEVALIETEEGGSRRFGFQGEAAGYASLKTARAFLARNGVPPEQITVCNPKTEDTGTLGTFDLVISLASCGFHYPVETYAGLFPQSGQCRRRHRAGHPQRVRRDCINERLRCCRCAGQARQVLHSADPNRTGVPDS